MPTLTHEFDWPDRVVVGTVGSPGSRTFYLQARAGSRTASVALEKEQSAVLAETIDQLLDTLRSDGDGLTIPTEVPPELADDDPLDQPVEEDFRAGAMRLGWDPRTSQVVVEAFPIGQDPSESGAPGQAGPPESEPAEASGAADPDDADPDDAGPSEVLVIRMPVGTARAFVQRTRRVILSGRPSCPDCGQPMDEDGHECAPRDDG
jgi:uncharacterized repeat protein (TIGR03847 family)